MIRMRTRRLAVVAAGLIAAASMQVAVAPAAQAALSGLRLEFGQTEATSPRTKTARANCADGQRPISGGGALSMRAEDQKKIVLTGLKIVGTRFEATAAELGAGTTNNWVVSAYAICAPPSQAPAPVSNTKTSADAQQIGGQTCPFTEGSIVAGVGAEITPPTANAGLREVQDISTRAGSRTNAVVLVNPGSSPQWSLTTSAVCLSDDDGEQRTPVREPTPFTSEAKTVLATCPPGKTLTGVGAVIAEDANNEPAERQKAVISAIIPFNDLSAVLVSAVEAVATTGNWSVTAEAYCGTHS